jgi:hypothetical protein
MAMFGALITSYGYTQKKYLLWDLFKKARYQRPLESLMIGDMGFAHRISFPAERIKSITVTTSHERLRAQRMSRRLKNTLSFFPILEEAVKDIQVRIFPCTSVYLLPWLFYDAEANMVKSVKGGPTAKEVGKDIKIQVRGTDNRIMEEFHIAVDNPQRECLVGSTHRRTTFFARAQELQFPPSVRDNGNSSSHHA